MRQKKKFNNVPYEYHQELILKIEDITNLGVGLARVDGWVVMVSGALTGETVKAKVFKNNKNYSEADLVEIIEKSPHRVEPRCSLFGKCGGCQYQNLDYKEALKLKKRQVEVLMEKIGGFSANVKDTFYTDKIYNYRSKITPHYNNLQKGQSCQDTPIGFLQAGKRWQLVDVPTCPIASEKINEALPDVRVLVRQNMNAKKGATLLLRDTQNGIITDNKALGIEKVGELLFEFTAGEFFQNNPHILPSMVDYAVRNAKKNGGKYLIDAYCGVGVFGLWAAKSFEKVVGIEISQKSVQSAIKNAKLNNIENCEFVLSSAEAIFEKVSFKGEDCSIIIDPPRKGASEEFLKQLIEFSPKKVVYVSCSPDTQARDLKFLKDYYNIVEITPFDLFPQTRHIESVAVLEKK